MFFVSCVERAGGATDVDRLAVGACQLIDAVLHEALVVLQLTRRHAAVFCGWFIFEGMA